MPAGLALLIQKRCGAARGNGGGGGCACGKCAHTFLGGMGAAQASIPSLLASRDVEVSAVRHDEMSSDGKPMTVVKGG